jgi:hypothetical protein
MPSFYSTVKKTLLNEYGVIRHDVKPGDELNYKGRWCKVDEIDKHDHNFAWCSDEDGGSIHVNLNIADKWTGGGPYLPDREDHWDDVRESELHEAEAFDKFDELYLQNHLDILTKLANGVTKDELGLDDSAKTEEIFQFWDMHQKQISDRVKGSNLKEGRGYGGWLSPSGKETSVSGRMDHGPVAEKILGDEWEERKGQGLEAAEILGKRGYARLVHEPNRTFVDMDTNAKLSHRQLAYLKDLGIENNVDVFLDVGQGRYLYKAGE